MKKYACRILLVIVIAAQMLYTAYAFTNWKTGLHSDEVWSFGFANSYYHPFMYLKDGSYMLTFAEDEVANWQEWVPGEEFWEYITVQEGERFAYDSVYYNNVYDTHPPLYYMVLHTVCSFFPERFSPWYGEILNLLFLVLTQIFLFLTVRKITGKEITALIVCVFYGASRGALLTFTFIRQYCMLLALCMIFTYFSTCFYEKIIKEGVFVRKYVIAAAVTAWLAFLTHYYGIHFIGTFTACFCLYLLLKKKAGAMLSYGFAMLIALGAALACYPAAIYHFLNNWTTEITTFSPPVQFRFLLSYLFEYDYGFKIYIFWTAFWDIALPLLGAGIVAVVALLFPFRDEPWFPKMIQWLRDKVRAAWDYIRRANYIPLFTVAGSLTIFISAAQGVDVLGMGAYVFRYISPTVPFFAMAAVMLATLILRKIPRLGRLSDAFALLIAIAVLVRVNMTAQYNFVFPQAAGKVDLVSEMAGKNVVIVDQSKGFFVTDTAWFTQYIYRAQRVCFTSGMTIGEAFHGNGGLDGGEIDYMIVDTEAFRLSEEEKAVLEARGDVRFEAEDANPHEYARTEEIKRAAGDRPYEILAIQQGQRATYLILKFE